ncbi:MAG TPA: aminopeptidase [Solirubrobacteraceae bacterium]|jgi:aminopeptidase|nr:aminopeptidase [Solirubrobacteraceae bacterium]
MTYTPPQEILERYASVLVNFALGGGEGVKAGEVVRIAAPESAKSLYAELRKAVWRAGGHVIGAYEPDDDARMNLSKDFFQATSEAQLDYFPAKYMRGLVDEMDHQVSVLAESDPHALESVDPARIMRRGEAMRRLLDWRTEKENEGHFSWTLGLYGTPAMAAEAKLSEEEYWEQIVHACFLDVENPIARWREVGRRLDETRERLDALEIERVHVQGEDVDLWVKIGEQRRWLGGRGRNIPSFEIFTSPDWRGTEGWIEFNQPLYRYGNLVKGIRLAFTNGLVTQASAEENEGVLTEMIATEGADKVGEFSLTDKRFSRITRFMAHTLYDENVGGPFGNTHIALGRSYQDAYTGDPAGVKAEDWERLGFNNSSVHTDIVSTTDRTVTAHMRGGEERVIYRDGEFQLD